MGSVERPEHPPGCSDPWFWIQGALRALPGVCTDACHAWEVVVCDAMTHSVCVPVKRRVEMPFLVTRGAAEARAEVSVLLPQARAAL